ncbi:unnamed protein product, partial [Ectocarpus sp. 8 AP-2014]
MPGKLFIFSMLSKFVIYFCSPKGKGRRAETGATQNHTPGVYRHNQYEHQPPNRHEEKTLFAPNAQAISCVILTPPSTPASLRGTRIYVKPAVELTLPLLSTRAHAPETKHLTRRPLAVSPVSNADHRIHHTSPHLVPTLPRLRRHALSIRPQHFRHPRRVTRHVPNMTLVSSDHRPSLPRTSGEAPP